MAIAHFAFVDALPRGLDSPRLKNRTSLPQFKIDNILSSPFQSRPLSPVSSRGPSPSPSLTPSFHTARSTSSTSGLPTNSGLSISDPTIDEPHHFSAYPISQGLADNDVPRVGGAGTRTHLVAPSMRSPSQSHHGQGQGRSAAASGSPGSRHPWEHDYDDRTAPNRSLVRSQASLSSLSRSMSDTAAITGKRSQDGGIMKSRTDSAQTSTSFRRRASFGTDDIGLEGSSWRNISAMTTTTTTITTSSATTSRTTATRTTYELLGGGHPLTSESVSLVSGVRTRSLILPPRSSSLLQSNEAILRLASLSLSTNAATTTTAALNDNHHLGKHPDAGIDAFATSTTADINAAADAVSVVSEPLTSSPSVMTTSLPTSTKTSLSRSARGDGATSSKDNNTTATATDAAAAAVAAATAADSGDNTNSNTPIPTTGMDPMAASRSAAAKQRSLTEKRRMILLEIVETEISYVHDLQALVHIYLPQLAALPSVTDTIDALVIRATRDLLTFHVQFAEHLVNIFKYCGMGYGEATPEIVETATKRIADIFVHEASSFSLYNDYCSGATTAGSLLRGISSRPDFEAFEKRCQYVSSMTANPTLRDLLHNRSPSPQRTRLRFQDIIIAPVQRVCRYPLLFAAILADLKDDEPRSEAMSAVERAQAIMRTVAGNADIARQCRDAEIKTVLIADRLDPHPALPEEFVEHLGICRLGGALDVLYHHPQYAPLDASVKVKYLAAFLYRGYLILAKVKRGNRFEAKHYLPLEAFELIDITEGFLPHSIRLTLGDHSFDLAASCDAEKEVWANELVAARNESTLPPFDLPSSVPLFIQTSPSLTVPVDDSTGRLSPKSDTEAKKRHTVVGLETLQGSFTPPIESPDSGITITPGSEYRRTQPATLLLRRESASQRNVVDRALSDIYFESLSTARSKLQLQQTNSPDSRRSSSIFDTPMIRRRLSFADSRTSLDVLAAPEVRGAVMPNRVRPRPRSSMVEFGAESGGANISRTTSFSSISDLGLRNQRSAVSLRRGFELGRAATRHRRQSASFSSLNFDNSARTRARSVPPSPAASCMGQFEPVAEPEEMVDIVENLASPSCVRRMSSDDSFVFIPDSETVLPTIALPKKGAAHRAMTAPTPSTTASTIKRSLSFFGRLSPSSLSLHDTSEEGGDAKSVKSDKGDKSDKSDKPEKTEFGQKLTTSKSTSSISIPNTSDASPPTLQGTKRRRSLRFFGQFRGFTPI